MKPQDAEELKKALETQFQAEVETEEVSKGRYRFSVVSATFDGKPHMARQDEAWALVHRVLDREASLDVSLILTLSPKDLHEQPHAA
jgi:hypothetical protein